MAFAWRSIFMQLYENYAAATNHGPAQAARLPMEAGSRQGRHGAAPRVRALVAGKEATTPVVAHRCSGGKMPAGTAKPQ